MFQMIQKLHNIDPSRTIMIGDRLDTDIEFGHNCGLGASVLVLTGVATLEDVHERQRSNCIDHQRQIPNYFIPSLSCLMALAKAKEEDIGR